MKRKTIGLVSLILGLILGVSNVFAQGQKGIDIIGFYGYTFGGKVSGFDGEINIKDSDAFGVAIDIDMPMKEGVQLELFWYQQPTTVTLRYFNPNIENRTEEVNVNYLQIGGVMGMQQDNIHPYGTISLGAAVYSPKDSRYSDTWRFAATLGLGAKIYLGERIGIRVDGRLLFPFTGVALGFGTGGASFGATSAIIQGNVNAGLILSL